MSAIKELGKEFVIPLAILGIGFGALLGGARGCNNLMNNREIEKPNYHTVSYATGINGHVEYTEYNDGSSDIKIYPGIGHRYVDSKLVQDLNGDKKADRIRWNAGEIKANRLSEILVRQEDYESHKAEFDKADDLLKELKAK